MSEIENYIYLVLKKGLNIKKNDSIFISLASNDSYLIQILNKIKQNLKLDNIFYNFYDIDSNKQEWGEYIEKNSKFLFIINDKFKYTFSEVIYNAYSRKEIDIDYLAIPSPSILFKDKENTKFLKYNNFIEEYNKDIKDLEKISNQIKNLDLKMLFINSFDDVELVSNLSKQCNLPVNNKKMVRYPMNSVELILAKNDCRGFIDASGPTFINGELVNSLRLDIKDGIIVDFDLDFHSLKDDIKKERILSLLNKRNFIEAYAVGLIDNNTKFYNEDMTNNFVLDDVAHPYILFKSKDLDSIYVPIDYHFLCINGVNNNGNTINLYSDNQILPKIYIKKF